MSQLMHILAVELVCFVCNTRIYCLTEGSWIVILFQNGHAKSHFCLHETSSKGLSHFYVRPSMKVKQTDRQTNTIENITSFAKTDNLKPLNNNLLCQWTVIELQFGARKSGQVREVVNLWRFYCIWFLHLTTNHGLNVHLLSCAMNMNFYNVYTAASINYDNLPKI